MSSNATLLARTERTRRFTLAALSTPALLLVMILLILPLIWLFVLSFVQKEEFSLAHYQRMLDYSSYLTILLTTLKISAIVTIVCMIIGYPVAYLIAQLPQRLAIVLLSLVVIPFWTSTLVRSYAWLVLLRDGGPINSAILWLGISDQPLSLLYNEVGTVVGMVHVMLPFFILPLYAGIRSFDWRLVQAAASLGAPPASTFVRVFLPLSLPGVFAGSVLVFVQCLGFFVTPAILGGGNVTMVSMKIASNIQQYFDWGAASAFGMILLVCALSILYFSHRLFDLNQAMGAR